MHICTIEVDGWRVAFESSRDLTPAFLRLAETPAFLGFGIFPQISVGEYKIRYEESSNEVVIKYLPKTAVIRAPWHSIQEGETLLYAAFPFVELQRQQHGFVTVHSAAVSINSRAILILGKEGSGKTITALGLCRTCGAQLIGNDLVIIGSRNQQDKLVAYGGTRFLSLRYESISRNMPDLLHLFPERNEDPWLRKVIVHPLRASIGLCLEETPLCGTFLVHVDETKDGLFIKSADSLVTRLYLNENFSRYIRGTCIALLGENLQYLGYVPSFDSETLFAKRTKLMDRLITEYSMKFVSGPLEKVVKYIASQCL
jgi:hypothetical protein